MISGIFYWVLNLSIFGSAAGLILLLLRRARRLPRLGIYMLWLLPLYRLCVPFGVANRYSLMSFVSQFTTKTLIVWEYAPPHWIPDPSWVPDFQGTAANCVQGAGKYAEGGWFPSEYKTDLLREIFAVGGSVWAAVAAGAVLCSVILYFFTRNALKDAEHINGNIYRSDKIASPAVYGIFRPRIILPKNLDESNLDYVLMHEKIHIRRRDNLWRVVAVLIACLHWFNPLAWIFLKCFFADMELACDAGVMKKLDKNKQKAYAGAILSCSAGRTYYASAFGGAKTRLRIENILSYKKLTLVSALCFAALFAMIALAVVTNAVG